MQPWRYHTVTSLHLTHLNPMTHPENPDAVAILARARRGRDAYLRWGRDCLGWAIYLFGKA